MKTLLCVGVALMAVSTNVHAQFGIGGGAGLEVAIVGVEPNSWAESITLENGNPFPLDLGAWRIDAGTLSRPDQLGYAFPDGCLLPPGAQLRLHAGPANLFRAASACGQDRVDLVWRAWFTMPDRAGVVTLSDPQGKVIARYVYPLGAASGVRINEIELNPGGSERGNEWVELYNASAQPVDLDGWTLGVDKGTTVKLSVPLEGAIAARGYAIVQVGIEFLNNVGEIVTLSQPGDLSADQSPLAGLMDELGDARCWARQPDGGAGWAFQPCTREAANAPPS